MRLAAVADCHIGNHRRFAGPEVAGINARCRRTLDCLSWAVDRALADGCELLLVLGDLFDTDRPTPQVVAAVQEVLRRIPTVAIVGNHDQSSTAPGDHALAPLRPVATVVERPEVLHLGGAALALVPFLPGDSNALIPEAVRKLLGVRRPKAEVLLGFHAGIRDAETPAYLREAPDSIEEQALVDLMVERRIKHAVSGNWHERKFVLDTPPQVALQVGALCPTGFDNPGNEVLDGFAGDYGWMAEWDSGLGLVTSIRVPGPLFVVTRSLEGLVEVASDIPKAVPLLGGDVREVFLLAKTSLEDHRAALDVTRQLLEAGHVAGAEAEVDREDQRRVAATAASAARRAGTIAEALLEYVNKASFEEGVDRAEVVVRAGRYLKI